MIRSSEIHLWKHYVPGGGSDGGGGGGDDDVIKGVKMLREAPYS